MRFQAVEVSSVSLAVATQDCHQKEIAGSAHAAFHITNWECNKESSTHCKAPEMNVCRDFG